MSMTSIGLGGLEKASMPTGSRFPSQVLPPGLNARFPPIDARFAAAARIPGLSMYSSPYTSPNFPSYLPYAPAAAAVAAAAADPSAFYAPLTPGENVDSWRASLTQAAATYYDPAMAAHYGYGYGPMGLSDGARRKNATRETTSTLKAWLNEHRKNPYPTKGEKIMLAIITKMTLTQVSTWFANARRRLKKENKMTWSPRNRCGEDDDDDDLLDDGPSNGETPSSRLPTPISPDLTPSTHAPTHLADRHCNGHSSGMESNSDEGMHYTETRREFVRSNPAAVDCTDKSESKNLPSQQDTVQARFEDAKGRLPASLLSRQHSHPYNASMSSSSLSSLSSNVSVSRPNLPFPQSLSQLPVMPPHAGMLHPGITDQLNHPSSLNRLPPHLMAALIEQAQQFQYQQALNGLPVNPLLSTSEAPKSVSTSTPSKAENLGSSAASRLSSSSSPPPTKTALHPSSTAKFKIWSIADVATSNDADKDRVKTKSAEERGDDESPKLKPDDIPNARMWMDLFQHKMAASMAGTMNAQQLSQLSTGLPPNPMLSQGRFPPFPTFPGFLGVPDNAKMNLKEIEKNSQDLVDGRSLSPISHSSDMKDGSEKLTNIQCRSPHSSYHGDSSIEGVDVK